MDIAALSTGLKATSLASDVSLAVTKKAMDTEKTNSDQMVQMLEQSASPNLGRNLNVRI